MRGRGPGASAASTVGRTALGVALWAGVAAGQAVRPAGDPAGEQPAASALRLGDVIATTLRSRSDIAIGELNVGAQRGLVAQATGAFDPVTRLDMHNTRAQTPSASASTPAAASTASDLGYEAALDWQWRSGVIVSPVLSVARTGASSLPGVVRNTGLAGVDLLVPLLRGRGGGVSAANERFALANLGASRADLSQLRAAGVFTAVSAYWGYVGATQSLAAFREAEGRARTLVQRTRTLIAADESPAVDSIAVTANLSAKMASRLAAENALAQARRTLALAMGAPADRLAALPPPGDVFPPAPAPAAVAAWPSESAWVAHALAQRPDVAAADQRTTAARNLVAGARVDSRSRLDLNVGGGYTSIQLGRSTGQLLAPFGGMRRGFETRVGLAYGLPFGNNVAEGLVARSEAAEAQAAVAARELRRTIALSVATSVEVARRGVEELRLSAGAVRLFAAALDGERQKFGLGTATLFDVITAEDNLTGAMLSAVDAQRRFAVAIAQLRFDSGTLLDGGACRVDDAPDRLTRLERSCGR